MFLFAIYLSFSTVVLWMIIQCVLAPSEEGDEMHEYLQQRLAEGIEGQNAVKLLGGLLLATLSVDPLIAWLVSMELFKACFSTPDHH